MIIKSDINKENIVRFVKRRWLIIIVFFLFLFQSYYFVFNIEIGEPPDENYHTSLSILQERSFSPFLENTEETYFYSDVEGVPFLYHYFQGLLLKLNIFEIHPTIFLRVFNPIYSFIGLIFIYKLSAIFVSKDWMRAFIVFLMSQTLSFTYISGSNSYDNFVNLFTTISLYYWIKFFRIKNLSSLALSAIFILLASISKITALAFLPIWLLGILIALYRDRNSMIQKIRDYVMEQKLTFGIYLTLIIILSVIFSYIYFGNIYKYGQIQPACDQVLSHEICLQHVGNYQKGERYKQNFDPVDTLGEYTYFVYDWSTSITVRLWGLSSHNILIFNYIHPLLALGLILSAIVVSVLKFDRKSFVLLFMPFILYVLILVSEHFSIYLKYGETVALQGRYLLIVLPLLYIFIGVQLEKIEVGWLMRLILVYSVIFALSGFYIHIINIEDEDKIDWNNIEIGHDAYYPLIDYKND